MSQSTISIRVDQGLKRKFDTMCEAFGLSATAAFNIFMKAVVREKRIPFEIRADVEEPARRKALEAFEILRTMSEENGLHQMSLEDINAEIKLARDERKKEDLRSN